MKNDTDSSLFDSPLYDCQCGSCLLWFRSICRHSSYCPYCAVDALVIAMPGSAMLETTFPFAQPAQVAGMRAAFDALLPMFTPEDTPRPVQVALLGLLGAAALVILWSAAMVLHGALAL